MDPIVYKPGTRRRGRRVGKGFSLGELQAVGLDFKRALKMGLRIDKRRRSVHKENIKVLKELLGTSRE